MVHTPVYYGPHPCVLWSTPLCTMEEERVRGEDKSTQALERAYGGRPIPLPHPTPVYYGPHPCVLWSTPLCTMVHTPVYYGGGEGEGREVHPGLGEGIWGSTNPPHPPHPCVLWSTPLCTMVTPLCTMEEERVRGEEKSTQALERAYGGQPIPLPHPTPVYYGPHPCVLWSTPLCTMVHTPVYYGPHPVYYGGEEGERRGEVHPGLGEGIWGSTNPPPPPHPCVLWSTPLCTMVHTPVYYGPHPCVLWRRRG